MHNKKYPIKVLVIGPVAPPYGGIQRYAEQLLKLSNKNYEIKIHADNIPHKWRPDTRTQGHTLNLIKRDGLLNVILTISFIFWKYVEFIIKICIYRPHFVHILSSNNLGFYRNCVYVQLSKITFSRAIMHHLGQFDVMIQEARSRRLQLIKWLLNTANLHVTQSYGLSNLLRIYTHRDVHTIYNPIDGIYLSTSENIQRDYSIKARSFLVVGYLGFSKGTFDILEVVSSIRSYFINSGSKIKFIGGGDISHFKKIVCNYKIESCIEFLGELDEEDKLIYLKDWADIFLLPSLAEGQPIAVLEAMAMRLPVIAGMVGSLPEIIQPNMGFLVKPKNHAELRAAIESCIESRGSLKNMGDNCRDWIVRQHSWGAFSDGVRELYK